MGVAQGLVCPNGNSASIDGRGLLRKAENDIDNFMILSFVDWSSTS
jgi:hypothetical protein